MSNPGQLTARALVVVLAALAVTAQTAYVDAVSLHALDLGAELTREVTPALVTVLASDAVVSVVAAVLALALAFRGTGRGGATGLSVAFAAWSYLLAYAGVVRLFRPVSEGVGRVLFDAHLPLVETLGLAGLVAFTAGFPTRLQDSDLADPATLPLGARPFQALRIRLLAPSGPWVGAALVVAALLALTLARGRPLQEAGLSPAMDLVRFGAVAVVILNLGRSWTMADATARGRLLWLGVGLGLLFGAVTILIGLNVLLAVTDWRGPAFGWPTLLRDAGLVGLLWGLSMSIFYDGSLDSDRLAREVAAAASAVTLLLLVASGLEALFGSVLVAGIALPRGFGTALAAVSAVTLYRPFRDAVDRALEPLLGGRQSPA